MTDRAHEAQIEIENAAEAARHLGVPVETHADYIRALHDADALDFDDDYVPPPPKPLVALPANSDLRGAEALYEPEQLADVDFVYREMLFMRSVTERLRDDVESYRIADLRRTDPKTADRVYGSTVDAGFELTPAGAAYVAEAQR